MSDTPPSPECFVIMPISDPEGYAKDHFKRVYEDILGPACTAAGFRPFRADSVKETNLIHLDILQRLLRAPMALCDLSTRNPNVLFELGLRQAFDQPVVLAQECDTPRIFDIAPLRVVDYRRARIYNEVIEDQKNIGDALRATVRAYEKKDGINSIVRLLALTAPATIPEVKETHRDPAFQIIRAELAELRNEIRKGQTAGRTQHDTPRHAARQLEHTVHRLGRRLAVMKETGVVDPSLGAEIHQALDFLDASWPSGQIVGNEARALRQELERIQYAYLTTLRPDVVPQPPGQTVPEAKPPAA